MRRLVRLSLSGIGLEKISTEIKNLKNLKWLSISSNKLEKLPDEICELKELEALFIGFNHITKLPAKFEELKKLKKISLADLDLGTTIENEIRNAFPEAEIEF